MTRKPMGLGRHLAFLIIAFCGYGAARSAHAHPVIFAGGWALSSNNSSQMNELSLLHSVTARWATGLQVRREYRSDLILPRINLLLVRANRSDSQANVYLGLGAGWERFGERTSGVRMSELKVDWESRRYLVAFDHFFLQRDLRENPTWLDREPVRVKGRLGWAPFLGEFTDLNVWWLAEAERNLIAEATDFTTYFRFYLRNVLWEVGAKTDGGLAFNYMIHF